MFSLKGKEQQYSFTYLLTCESGVEEWQNLNVIRDHLFFNLILAVFDK